MSRRIIRQQRIVVLLALLASFTCTAVAAPNQAALQEARDLIAQSQQLFDNGHFQEAAPPAGRAVEIRERELGPKNVDTADAIHQFALAKYALGAYSEAEALFLRAIAVREGLLGPAHPDVADSLNQLGKVYYETDEFAKSEVNLQRAVAIYKNSLGLEDPKTAMSLNNLGNLYFIIDEIGKAEDLYRRSLLIREKVLGPEHIDTADSLANLAIVNQMTGDYKKSIQQYRRAIAIREKVSGPDHPRTANLLSNLGIVYTAVGEYATAEQLIKRALVVHENTNGPEHLLTALDMAHLGVIYHHTGAYSMAETLQQRALAILQKQFGLEGNRTAFALGSLALLYQAKGDYEKVEPLFLQVILIIEKAQGTESISAAINLTNLGSFYADTNSFAKADLAYTRALGIIQRQLGIESPVAAEILYALGNLYANTGDVEKSEKLHLQALSISEKTFGYGHPKVIESLNALASVSWRKGSTAKALQLFTKAQTMQARNSERFLVANSETRRRAYLQVQRRDVFRSVSFAVSQPTRDGILLGLTSVLQHKGRVLDESTDSIARLRDSMNAKDQIILEQLTEVTTHLSNLTYQTGALTSSEYKQRSNLLLQHQDALEADLAKRSSEFRKQVTPVTVAAVGRAIPQDAALVEWFRYGQFDPKAPGVATKDFRYAAFVLKQGVDPIVVDIGDARSVDALIHDFRLAASDPKRVDVKTSAAALSESIMKPLREHLNGVNQLLMSPDGSLNLIPMAALLDENGAYLAQRFEMTYVTSGRDLLNFDSKSRSRSSAMVMANPEFGSANQRTAQADTALQSQRSADLDRGGLIFRPLTNTALEAQDLKQLLKLNSQNVLLDGDATESNIKKLHGPRILHVASHGFFLSDQELTAELKKRNALNPNIASGENPLLRAGIALAGANARLSGNNNDGILTALEVAQLDLHGTELVVLSACDSGVGEVQNGEGVYGLRRALVLAGAQTQVTSLWKVSDEATRTLMVDFYKRLLNGEGRSAALRHAQQHMLANPELAHPYYWASFVPSGNWAPLPTLH